MHCCGHWCAPLRRFIRVHRRVKFFFYSFWAVRFGSVVNPSARFLSRFKKKWIELYAQYAVAVTCILGIPFNQMQLQTTANTMKVLKIFPKADLHHANNNNKVDKTEMWKCCTIEQTNHTLTHSFHPFVCLLDQSFAHTSRSTWYNLKSQQNQFVGKGNIVRASEREQERERCKKKTAERKKNYYVSNEYYVLSILGSAISLSHIQTLIQMEQHQHLLHIYIVVVVVY